MRVFDSEMNGNRHIALPRLKRFFVINPTFIKGDSPEARSKAILYFYPEDTPLMKQVQFVGFGSAIIQFTRYVSASV